MYWQEVITTYLYKARAERMVGRKTKDFGAAFATLFEALSKDQRYSEIWCELAYCYEEIGEHKRAMGMAYCAIQQMPSQVLFPENNKYHDQPWRIIARAYEALGQKENAAFAITKVLEQVPHDHDMKQKLLSLNPNKTKILSVLRPGAIGDIIMSLWAIEAYKRKNPDVDIHYYCHANCMQVPMLSGAVSNVFDYQKTPPPADAISLVGYPIQQGYPKIPMSRHLVQNFGSELGVSESLLDTSWQVLVKHFDGSFLDEEVNTIITVNWEGGWSPYKNWPIEKWQEIVDWLKVTYPNCAVYEICDPKNSKLKNCYPASTSLMVSMDIVARADLHLGIDSWPNHLRGAVKKPAVILWGSTSPIGSGYKTSTNIWKGHGDSNGVQKGCSPCYREYPGMTISPIEPAHCPNLPDVDYWTNPKHPCMQAITVDEVKLAIKITNGTATMKEEVDAVALGLVQMPDTFYRSTIKKEADFDFIHKKQG